MRKIILTNYQAPGDIVMLTAAVRDLHRCQPGKFQTDVRTSCPELWLGNPHLTPLKNSDPEVETIECHYPLVEQSNERPYHFLHGFMEYLSERLQARFVPMEFKGDIHLSRQEQSSEALADLLPVSALPYWLIAAGGKIDYTIKWWSAHRFQQVVDAFKGRIRFVQVGAKEHVHPPLQGVIDLRGKTNMRQLISLVHHAEGVVCPVTLLMHLAAAVSFPANCPATRPCVVIAGGREPPHWEAYPTHQFIHTVGALPCCETGGCWRSRTVPLGDHDIKDRADHLCVDVVGDLPRCMNMITADMVIARIEWYCDQPRTGPN